MAERPLAETWEAQSDAWRRMTRTPGLDHHFHRYNWPAFLELVPEPGCGEGRGGVALRELGHRVTGIDAAPSMVRLAYETGAYDDVIHADAAALPLDDETFDLVIAFMSLQDMDDADGAVRESARVLRRGGRLIAAIVHPFASAHLGRSHDEQRPYFGIQTTIDTIDRDGVAFTFHQVHRPLAAWVALVRDAGYLIEDVREPRPSERDVRDDPSLAKTRARPAFLHVGCWKPHLASSP
jgi:SAM-dependent methyltransferase